MSSVLEFPPAKHRASTTSLKSLKICQLLVRFIKIIDFGSWAPEHALAAMAPDARATPKIGLPPPASDNATLVSHSKDRP
jgi:hypothetical protein